LDRSKLKADLVFKFLLPMDEDAMLDIELQAGADPEMLFRVLLYIAALYAKYKCTIICLIIYLFPCTVVTPPPPAYWEKGRWEIHVLCLWEEDPVPIVEQHLIPLYFLLPAMKNPSVALLRRALSEMRDYYPRDVLAYRFRWFYSILRRSKTMSEEDKQIIEEELKVQFHYNDLIKDDPVIQNLLAQSKSEGELLGEMRGKMRGEIEGMKKSILNILNIRFSAALAKRAQPALQRDQDFDLLDRLQRQIIKAPDEQTVLLLLDLPDEPVKNGSPKKTSKPSRQAQSGPQAAQSRHTPPDPSDEQPKATPPSATVGQAIPAQQVLPDELPKGASPNGQASRYPKLTQIWTGHIQRSVPASVSGVSLLVSQEPEPPSPQA
jgi:predicted transposase YdaD